MLSQIFVPKLEHCVQTNHPLQTYRERMSFLEVPNWAHGTETLCKVHQYNAIHTCVKLTKELFSVQSSPRSKSIHGKLLSCILTGMHTAVDLYKLNVQTKGDLCGNKTMWLNKAAKACTTVHFQCSRDVKK